MLFVDNQETTDPRLNLAIEEHLLRNVQVAEPLLLFYINAPSVIIGRNQNSIEEIDPDFVRQNQIYVVRRLSGGGAVYHDLGNLNFSFITQGRQDLHNFDKFTQPVVTVLQSLGVNAALQGKSDIFVEGKKISGNAQYASQGRMFSHGTILFDTNLENMLRAINPRQMKIESKSVQSVRSFVTNIREHLSEEMRIDQLRQALLAGIFGQDDIPAYPLTDSDWEQIREIATQRYMTWDWNYGRSPSFNIQKSEKLSVGKLDARIEVEKGLIQAIKIYGDFSGPQDVAKLEKQLTGLRYDRDEIAKALTAIDLALYFGAIDKKAFLDLLF
ncbi:MAG: lipoate--protein ligase [Ardenticatenaceae bacterium]|nr:lipoate--protein ligase [Anaerolineales bacterium]MCB8941215.1 lipoate--protein ligase [Ardenticatenaceae bacterium]MCB8972554.1 lipoate--protein ligase [Ardenticatenaceae bacterium]